MERKKYKRIKFEDRKKIEIMLKQNADIKDIAAAIGVHKDTIYKELKRNEADKRTYTAEAAQAAL